MRQLMIGLTLGALLALNGCGTATDDASTPSGGGGVQITPAAIAAVATDHLPDNPSSASATYRDEHTPKGYLGADFRYRAGGESDGDLVRVTMRPHQDKKVCTGYDAGCVELAGSPAGAKVTLSWQEIVPEEDPGIVVVVLQRPAEDVTVVLAGPTIDKDPRDLDLDVSVESMQQLVQDDRLHLMTTQDVVDAGADLAGFDPGDYDPADYDRVPANDASLAGAYILGHGGYLAFSDQRESPLKADFDKGAVGSRFERDNGTVTSTIDVLASPRPLPWMSRDVCETPRFADHCLATKPGTKGTRYLAWVPGADGEIWEVAQRPDEVVVFRHSGFRVPEARGGVMDRADWYLDRGLLNHTATVGLTTRRYLLDFNLAELLAE